MSENGENKGEKSLLGRRTLLTPALISIIVLSIQEGLTYKDAAHIVNIPERTFYYWQSRGRTIQDAIDTGTKNIEQLSDNEKMYLHFYHEVQKAVPLQKQNLIHKIMKAADKNWTAAAWLLERKYPDEFGRRARVDVYNWRVDVVKLIKQGLRFDELAREIGDADATELFESAGVGIIEGRTRPETDKTG